MPLNNIVAYLSHRSKVAWSPGSPIFSTYTREEGGAWDPTSREKCQHDVMEASEKSVSQQQSISNQLQFIKNSSLRPSRILLHSLEGFGIICSIRCWTGTLENIACPRALFMIHLPSYSSIRYGPMSVGSQAPPLALMYIEKIGEPGDEARSKAQTVQYMPYYTDHSAI